MSPCWKKTASGGRACCVSMSGSAASRSIRSCRAVLPETVGGRMSSNRHLLVTSAARKIPLLRAAISAARKLSPDMQVLAGDLDPDAPAQYVADGFWAMPRTDDTALDALITGCKERGIGVVLPTRDGELLFWARHKARFAREGIAVLVSPEDSVTRCLDKL